MKKFFEKLKLIKLWIKSNIFKSVPLLVAVPVAMYFYNAPTEFSMVFVGDTGTGDSDQAMVATAMKQENISDLRVLGDVIYESGLDGENDKQFDKKFYRFYKDFKKIGIALGNHDHLGDASAWLKIAKRYSNVFFPNYYYSEKINDLCLMTIDSEKIDQSLNSQFTKDQVQWIRNTLQGFYAAECKLIIAMGHHPRYSVGEHGDAEYNFKKFFDAELMGKVDVYISGHDHNLSYEGEINGTHHLTSGAGGQLRGLARGERVYAESKLGYVVMDYKGNGKALFRFKTVKNNESTQSYQVEIQGQKRGQIASQAPSPIVLPAPSNEKINGVTWSIQYKDKLQVRNRDYHIVDLFDVKDEDLGRIKASGSKPVCYFSSQYEEWRPDANKFVGSDLGKKLDTWKGERWIKTKSENVRSIMLDRIRLAKERGCYAIDVDNTDFYSYGEKTGFSETKEDAINYVTFLINAAHSLGMKYSLKNSLELIDKLDGVDFYQNESCHQYNECNVYKNVKKPVFNIEYKKCYTPDFENMFVLFKPDGMGEKEEVCK